ncbi:antibiotic biosynthesis monooxygenase [Alteromonas sp. KUL156]|uniref:antibiotic biosynthesis monooxygenase family protein n=1 Tax=Tenacibaculum sp. XPcli2-G TaxID=2954503 RepID=UPI0012E6E510|nr:antibiotic biosynthesis monooxygenase [Tenacibaculum sp. XPcli2-G]BFF38308.1 antibiotic biosynthesis monooxygenase [Tenacibaculum mesophilum]GFD75399.1 antibiotic biosynthesis monooxygenase [Tenacibaculum sp. KUL113]GFD96328.1 antibiotic biosynthesis monooxygenase [Alteromonas sp. KUL154]GFE00017.1 antibiotic biosynthesis monooxygenase [Alteromonas sp. KUL156]MCO7185977.1 antibiotic biosynthesis monooxygenase [Tenacibaculum sp. XPcli2-G]|eukprot:TRINITY_DN19120_c0_g1_i1.p1 TRINITY_DN19120_c0_g1~~TRINITY_DN19120_c0_g1_i1.p1  ORF type:complete len:107 (-),score=19.08 TRINITY_DN19120_c0_g1_i1:95-415(-)
MIVDNLKLPYYAVIFTTTLSDDTEGYYEMAEKMDNLAKEQDGYLGVESTRSNVGITVSYWESLDAIVKWKNNVEHTEARNKGRERWYKKYQLRICKVEREYGFEKG